MHARFFLIAALMFAPASPLLSQDTTKPAETFPRIRLIGQVRERSEIDDRSFTEGRSPDALHYLRSRFGAMVAFSADITATVELQDARLFGQNQTTQNVGSPALDLRQGVIEIRNIGGAPIGVRLGRQVFGYANERLVGRVDWINTSPSYDGLVATLGDPELFVDLLGVAIARHPLITSYQRDVFLAGAWGAWKPKEGPVNVQAFYLFDNPHPDSITIYRHTTGLYSSGVFGGFDYEVDGALQFGDYRVQHAAVIDTINPLPARREDRDIAASLIGLRLGYTLEDVMALRLGAGLDLLSGNDPDAPTTYGAFNTMYATNHKFYGSMDYFTNIPLHTRGQGLRDIIVQAALSPSKEVRTAIEFHVFDTAVDPEPIGQELDLTVSYKPIAPLTVTGGISAFFADPDRKLLAGTTDMSTWGYLMLTAGF